MTVLVPSLARMLLIAALLPLAAAAADRPNVLFIAVDDLNDWVGEFYGNPQAVTPHLDRFAASGAVMFQNAHCPGPVCGPSRSAILSGFLPSSTGAYGNTTDFRDSKLVQQHATLPEYFSKHGYVTVSRGKISHAHGAADGMDYGQWMFDVWERAGGDSPFDPARMTSRNKNIINGRKIAKGKGANEEGDGSEFAWGPTVGGKEETSDYRTAQWAAQQLTKTWEKPFFMAIGISKPHLPFKVPQEYFERFPLEHVRIPEYREDDFDDILDAQGRPRKQESADFKWVSQDPELFKGCIQAYLAASSYADECVGVVLDALNRSPHAQNTIVVIWGDHGWHLGEKLRFRKATLWRESTRVPLMIKLPHASQRRDSFRPVNLIDLYPTLIDLCGLPGKQLDGRSLAPLLDDPLAGWPHPTITISGPGNTAVMDERWHYIRQRDGSEELYDIRNDPMCWRNLANLEDPVLTRVKAQLAAAIPATFAPPLKSSGHKKDFKHGPSATLNRDLSTLK